MPLDAESAIQWYLKAALQGHAEAQFNLGTSLYISYVLSVGAECCLFFKE